MTGNHSNIDLETFAYVMAAELGVSRSQISGLAIVPANTTAGNSGRSITSDDPTFVLLVTVSYSSPPDNQNTSISNALINSSSLVVNYLSRQDLNVVSVNCTVILVDTTTTSTSSGMFLNVTDPIPKTFLEKYVVYVAVGVPSVVVAGAGVVGGVTLFRRKANVMRRKRNWDMHNMYSSISLVDYT